MGDTCSFCQGKDAEQEDEFVPTIHMVNCLVCLEQIKNVDLSQHLDERHLVSVDKTNCFICLICLTKSRSYEQHEEHFEDSHPTHQEKGKVPHLLLREEAKKIQEEEPRCVLSDPLITHGVRERRGTAVFVGEQYEAIEFQREYPGAEYKEQMMEGELVWSKLFQEYSKKQKSCRWYSIVQEPLLRSIVCTSILLFPN